MKIEVIIGNIVKQPDMEAIVNSANANLRMGSGVAGAVHTAAGPRLEEYCRAFAPLELGSALITPGFQLPNRWIIHVRAAHYINNTEPERYLAFAIASMTNVARDNDIQSIALPAIGTGVFKFPSSLAAKITAQALMHCTKEATSIEHIRICVSSAELRDEYQSALDIEMASVDTVSNANKTPQ